MQENLIHYRETYQNFRWKVTLKTVVQVILLSNAVHHINTVTISAVWTLMNLEAMITMNRFIDWISSMLLKNAVSTFVHCPAL